MEEGAPSAPPLPCPKPACPPLYSCDEETWLAQFKRARLVSNQWLDCGILCLTIVLLILCGVCYLFCPTCLFGILCFCAILCPCVHPLNAPLWVAIILLTLSGWSFTTGAFSVSWNAKK